VTLSDQLAERVRSGDPVALATVIEGEGVGSHLLIVPGEEAAGSLGHPDLDRVVHRDGLAELEAGRSGIRTYGPQGQTTPEDLESLLKVGLPHLRCGFSVRLISRRR
jgi:xanthine dehydrogenase accessory factor